jgi:hypothetical protein
MVRQVAAALLLDPGVEIGPGLPVDLHRNGMVTGPKGPPNLLPTEERDQVHGDFGAAIASRLAPHQPRISRLVHDLSVSQPSEQRSLQSAEISKRCWIYSGLRVWWRPQGETAKQP